MADDTNTSGEPPLLNLGDVDAIFSVLRQSSDSTVVTAIHELVRAAPDHKLCRINVLNFVATTGLDEESVITAFLHAARMGMFELSWSVLCPGCGGVLNSSGTLKTIHRDRYECALCSAGHSLTLDETVEVTFTVSSRVRRIMAHTPETLPIWEYYRQIFWSSGNDFPDNFEEAIEGATLDAIELPPGQKAVLSLPLPVSHVIVFEPVTHAAHFLEVEGDPTRERQNISIIFNKVTAPTGTTQLRPGPVRLAFENQTAARVLPGIWIGGTGVHHLLSKRKPFLTAKRLLTNQAFRDLYGAETVEINQRLSITSLTFLFTDLAGSTALYERVGDIAAYDIVRAHFGVLTRIIASQSGAVVKTIGDAVMATFPTPDKAIAAAIRMRDAMRAINKERKSEDLLIKIGIHEGPCLAVNQNERQDYFGQTVNVASRVQNLATSDSILTTERVLGDPRASTIIEANDLKPVIKRVALKGVSDHMAVYAIP